MKCASFSSAERAGVAENTQDKASTAAAFFMMYSSSFADTRFAGFLLHDHPYDGVCWAVNITLSETPLQGGVAHRGARVGRKVIWG
jgi:hypothetical protein